MAGEASGARVGCWKWGFRLYLRKNYLEVVISKVTLENVFSFRNETVELGKVNVCIGPNNSGKSNFLAALLRVFDARAFETTFPAKVLAKKSKNNTGAEIKILSSEGNKLGLSVAEDENHKSANFYYNDRGTTLTKEILDEFPFRETSFIQLRTEKLQRKSDINHELKLKDDGSNLTSFLYSISQNERSLFKAIEKGLFECTQNFEAITFPAARTGEKIFLLQLIDKYNSKFLADEVSDGVLAFLFYLTLCFQPQSPKLLLIDEPETGIHPGRIHELLDYMMELARTRDELQIVFTTHSPIVVDYFSDTPESILVFDMERGETKVRNLQRDIIEPDNEAMKKAGLEPNNYTSALSDHWIMGMLGGVPK